MDFTGMKELYIPEGKVKMITFPDGSTYTFESSGNTYPYTKVKYVYVNQVTELNYDLTSNSLIQIGFKSDTNNGCGWLSNSCPNDSKDWRLFNASKNLYLDIPTGRRIETTNSAYPVGTEFNVELGNYYIKDLNTGNNIISSTSTGGSYWAGSGYSRLYLCKGYGNNPYSQEKIYFEYMKVYEGGTLVRDYYAVKTGEGNNTGAIYDEITDTLIGSSFAVTEYT